MHLNPFGLLGGVLNGTMPNPGFSADALIQTQVFGRRAISGVSPNYGTYTPTLTNVANLDASTAYSCQYSQTGNVVTVSGRVDIDPTAGTTLTQLGVSLPIPSNFANANECAGVAFASGIAGQGAAIIADATNDRAELDFISGDTSNQPMYFIFSYRII